MKNILIFLTIIILACGIFLSGCEVNNMANEYVRPTGHIDSSGSWLAPSAAYDGTYVSASVVIPANSWSNYLELTISAIYCSKVKFLAGYDGTAGINKIDIDVYYADAWHDVYEGSFLNYVYTEKSLGATYNVTRMRIRLYNNASVNAYGRLGEAQFYQVAGIPILTTNAATFIESESATLNGNITSNGGASCTARGFKYKEGIAGAEQDSSDSGYFGTGVYSKDLTGLTADKEYYFKAYATNASGTGYGEWLSFKTPALPDVPPDIVIPTVTSSAATSVDHEKATLNGEITETGGEDPEERGFQWKIGVAGDIEELPETGSFGVGTYSLDLEDLSANTEYYFRAYAKNTAGTAYGTWLNFTTEYTTPEVTTHNATDELKNQVTGNGEIVSTGGQDCDERRFEYGLSKVPTWLKNEVAGGYGVGFFDLTIDGLTANTEYWYRACAKFILESSDSQKTTTSYNKQEVHLQIDGTKIYYIWKEKDSSNLYQIWTAISDLDGSNFTATKRTTLADRNSGTPSLQIVGDIEYCVYECFKSGTGSHIFIATMSLDQTGFTVKEESVCADLIKCLKFQVVGDKIYLTWLEKGTNSKYQVRTGTVDTDGNNWADVERTTNDYTKQYGLDFYVFEDNIYYIYLEQDAGGNYQVWTATMTIAGASWTATKQTTSGNYRSTQLSILGSCVYYVYSTTTQIVSARSSLNGTNWTATIRTSLSATALKPQLQIVGSKIYYTFINHIPGGTDHIYSAFMNIDQTGWSQTQVTTSETVKEESQLYYYNGKIHLVWSEQTSSYFQVWTLDNTIYIAYGEWVKFITAATGTIPTGTKKVICSDYSGYTYRTQASETDDGAEYVAYFVISTDLTNKKGLAYYKRILDLHLYFKNQVSGTVTVEVKRDSEPAWQEVGEVTLTGVEEILVKHLATNIRAKHFLFKLSATNKFKFLGCLFEFIKEGNR